MNYQLLTTLPQHTHPLLVISFFADDPLDTMLPLPLTATLHATLSQLTKGQHHWHVTEHHQTVLFIACGTKDKFDIHAFKAHLTSITHLLTSHSSDSLLVCMPQLLDLSANQALEQIVLHLDAHFYELNDYKTTKPPARKLTHIDIYLPDATQKALDNATALAKGISLTKRLADLPANVCTPRFLGEQALNLAKEHTHIKTTLLFKEDIQALNMNAYLAVAQGSHEPPCFIEMTYTNAGTAKPIVLIGKGVTFDSGGLTLKPGNVMDEMKYDMAGAASVIGTLKACALLKLPINVVGLIAATENMPGGGAVKPGDIVKSMSGQTIEILNTDAEGRLTLADALTYASRFKPESVIDIATLTGAVIVALGHQTTGLMTRDEALAERLLTASATSLDDCWRLPMDSRYDKALDSPIADMINARFERSAGSITAACFLARFAQDFPWAHLDIAGTAWIPGSKPQATGRPVALLTQLLRSYAHAS
ncbi:MAG: leucyl aminopeptidase [Legionellaceae bacterium]|nr:leucyl aminopeptidase [Legionellaceae bacterium]|tara:strand:+ start:6796 stop:8235 length:1440 start_codon:yes stop_codon:yes gene_type:complete